MKKYLLFGIFAVLSFFTVSAQNDTVCAGATSVNYWLNGSAGSTFSWSIGGGSQTGGTTTDSIQVDFSSTPGIDTITVVETDSNGCLGDPVKLAVVRVAPPTVSIAGATSLCFADSTNVTVTLTGNSPWDLTYDDGSGNTIVTVTSSPYLINTSSLTTSTTYTLVNVEDRLGCTTTPSGGSSTVLVTVYPQVVTGTIQHN